MTKVVLPSGICITMVRRFKSFEHGVRIMIRFATFLRIHGDGVLNGQYPFPKDGREASYELFEVLEFLNEAVPYGT